MNINLPFDYNSNIDDVNIVLMNNSLERIGNINCFQNFNCILNYNAADEISFDVYKYIDDIQCKYWEAIYDLKNVFVEELSEVFKIYISIDDSDQTIKHVIGRSLCEDELSNIKLYDVQINTASDILREDYTTPTVFCNENHKNSLLHRILEKAPHYSIEYVSPSLKNLQYTFEFDECSIYEALTEIGQKIGCIFKFNSLQRTISAYDLKNYCPDCNKRFDEKTDMCPYCNNTDIVKGDGNDTVITISKDSIASMTSLDNDEDSYINCLRIKTGDEMVDATVRNINPNGSEYIYYFNEDIINDMPDELVNKINDYNEQNEYYNDEYVFDLDDNGLKNDYNSLVTKYNGDTYKNYKYDEDDDKVLQNNTFIDIDNNIVGFEKIVELYYDNIDFQLYLESNLMPYVLQEDVSMSDDIKNLTVSNLSPIALSELSSYTSVSTVEIYIKKYAALYLKNSYIIEVVTEEYDFEGGRDDGWNYGSWKGKIKLTEYGSEKESLETATMTLEVNDNYQVFLDEKILTSLRDNDDSIGSIYNIMSIKNDTDFKNALKLYSLSRLKSFEDAYQSGVDVMIEADQANESADFYEDIYVPLYNRLQYIIAERTIRENEVTTIERTQQRIEEIKATIQESLNFESYIGTDLWKIFCTYRREDVYTNDNITSEGLSNTEIIKLARDTIENAQKNIKEIGYLQKNIVCSLNNFLAMPEFESYKGDFNLGNWIICENDEKLFKQRLVTVNVSISNEVVISVDLSQVTRTEDELNDVKSILNQASNIGASIGEIKNSIVQSDRNNQIVSNWVENGLDLTNLKIISNASNQSVVYDKNGILVRSYDNISNTYDPEQLKIINSTIAITKDNWNSIETAIGRIAYTDPRTNELKYDYGVNAKILIGKLILGESLGIYNSSNSLSFDENGFVINATKNQEGKYQKLFDIQIDGESVMYIDTDNGFKLSPAIGFEDTTLGEYIDTATQYSKNVNIILSNEYSAIPTDPNGNNGNFSSCYTTVQVFYGSEDVTNKVVFETSASNGVQYSFQNKIITVSNMTTDSGYVSIKTTYNNISVTKKFNIVKQKQGIQGIQGEQGIGVDGKDGKTSYFHIKYSSVASPTSSSQMKENPDKYIGTYVDFTESDSNNPNDYTWSQFIGDDGIPGTNGENGETSYLHIKYSNDGGKTFTSNNGEDVGLYIGQYVDFVQQDSSTPSKYKWALIKGADGQNGQDGADGEDGVVYEIISSTNTIKITESNNFLPTSVTFSAIKRTGSSGNTTAYSGRFKIEESTNGSIYATKYISSANESSKTWSPSSTDVISIRCSLYLAGGTATLLDIQSVTILTDVSQLTQQIIFNKLTNNGQLQGLFMQDGNLYINASYLSTGIIADKAGKFSLNMTTGKAVLSDGEFSGTITASTIFGTSISGGTITGASITGGSITSDTTINVTTDLKVGNNIHLGSPADGESKYIYFNNQANIRLNGETIMLDPGKGDTLFGVGANGIIAYANSIFEIHTPTLEAFADSIYLGGNVTTSGIFTATGNLRSGGGNQNTLITDNWIGFYRASDGERVGWMGANSSNDLHILPEKGVICLDGQAYFAASGTRIYGESANGSNNIYIRADSGYGALYSQGTAIYFDLKYIDSNWTHGKFNPGASGVALGGNSSSQRWYRLYATNACSTSSDRRLKENVMYFDEMPNTYGNNDDTAMDIFFKSLKPSSFNMIDDEYKRMKFGFIAQDVIKSLENIGLTVYDVDFVSHGRDENDNISEKAMYGLCYEEFIALNTHMIQKTIARVDNYDRELHDLRNENAQLKQELKNTQDKLDAFINGNFEIREVNV